MGPGGIQRMFLAIEWYEKYHEEGWLMNLNDIIKDTGQRESSNKIIG